MPDKTVTEILAERQRIYDAATGGLWIASDIMDNGEGGILTEDNGIVFGPGRKHPKRMADCEYVVDAPTYEPRLIEALEFAISLVEDAYRDEFQIKPTAFKGTLGRILQPEPTGKPEGKTHD